MMKLAKAECAQKPKTVDSVKVAYFYAAILVVLALAQLFTFDEFNILIEGFNLPGGLITARLAAALIVVSEVLSLPFLLRLKLSELMRIFSMILSWIVPIFWFKTSLWLVLTKNPIENIGILGTVIDVTPGWWMVFVSIGLGILSAWVSWGLWPIKPVKKSK